VPRVVEAFDCLRHALLLLMLSVLVLVLDNHSAHFSGFASSRTDVEEREDGADDDADANDYDHYGEAVRAA
jgi:hypothetical protein